MTFKVPPSKADEPQNRYTFEIDGTTYDVPKLGFIKGDAVEALVEAAQYGNLAWRSACYDLFGEHDTDAGRAVRALESDAFDALQADYFKASNLSLGESSASTDS
jgi:hypothetical protein